MACIYDCAAPAGSGKGIVLAASEAVLISRDPKSSQELLCLRLPSTKSMEILVAHHGILIPEVARPRAVWL